MYTNGRSAERVLPWCCARAARLLPGLFGAGGEKRSFLIRRAVLQGRCCCFSGLVTQIVTRFFINTAQHIRLYEMNTIQDVGSFFMFTVLLLFTVTSATRGRTVIYNEVSLVASLVVLP